MQLRALVAVSLLFASGPLAAQEGKATPVFGAPKAFPYDFKASHPPAEELKARRAKLAAAIKDGVAVAVSQEPPSLYSGARYKPDNNVYYLTGVESDFCALLLVAKDGKVARETLFLPKYDAGYELWNGKRATADDADVRSTTGVEDVVAVQGSMYGASLKPFSKALEAALAGDDEVFIYTDGGVSKSPRLDVEPPFQLSVRSRADALADWLAAKKPQAKFRSLVAALTSQRGVKSAWEIEQVRSACRATGEGFIRGLRKTRPGMWEFEFDAIMQHAFLELGCTGVPYYPIAASGPNGCVLHYTENRRRFEDGDVVLADIAAEWGWYASDVTRSFPANGKFTERQRRVYEAVLAGQTAAAEALKPGTNFAKLDSIAKKAMAAAGLRDSEMHPHGMCHHVGLAVHDPGDMIMKPGMIITIEPGSYLKKEGFGVRIEDCYLVTENGSECLSAGIPKTVAEIEALVGADYREK
jgi:Xaa-Pro aminopeptidase